MNDIDLAVLLAKLLHKDPSHIRDLIDEGLVKGSRNEPIQNPYNLHYGIHMFKTPDCEILIDYNTVTKASLYYTFEEAAITNLYEQKPTNWLI